MGKSIGKKKRSPFHNVYRYLKTIYQNLKTKNLYEKSTNLFLSCRGVTLLFICAKVLTFSTPAKNFQYKSSIVLQLLIYINDLCVHDITILILDSNQ